MVVSFCLIAFVYVLKVSSGVEGVSSPAQDAARNNMSETKIFDKNRILSNTSNNRYNQSSNPKVYPNAEGKKTDGT